MTDETKESRHQGADLPRVALHRDVPVRYEADVAVVGAGIAGLCAAASAARSGARVVLVERFAVPGGMLTTGGVANFCHEAEVRRPLGEVFSEIVSALDEWGAIGHGKPSVFHHETFAFIAQEMLLKRGVKLLLHTRCVDALATSGGRVTEALVCGASGLEALRARQFIDCTGESSLARAAGFETLSDLYEGRWRLPMSMMYFVRETGGQPGPPPPEGWAPRIEGKEQLPMASVWPDGPGGKAIKVKTPMFDSTDTESMTDAEIDGRRRMMSVTDYHLRVEGRPWRLDHCSPIIGIREGARVAGDYVLTVDDLRAGRAFDDAVARGTYQLDAHKPDDDKRTCILPKEEIKVPPYQIPLRSLIARDGENLLMAGRNMSADQLALSSARVATSGAMMGQAAGIASAMAAQGGVDARDLDPADVQREVEKRGADLSV